MPPEEQAKIDAEIASAKAKNEADAKAKADAIANPDPLKKELEKVQGNKTRTEAEKAAFNLMKNAERVKELGLDPKKVLGLDDGEEELDDDKPVTHGDLRKREVESAQKTALSKADEIENETERELTKHHLVSTIKPSGNSDQDLANARAIVNASKNAQLIEEARRKTTPKAHSSAAGGAAATTEEFEPTDQEKVFMRAPFNVSKEKILEARKKEQQ